MLNKPDYIQIIQNSRYIPNMDQLLYGEEFKRQEIAFTIWTLTDGLKDVITLEEEYCPDINKTRTTASICIVTDIQALMRDLNELQMYRAAKSKE